jgi:hypothetical protein
VTPTELKLAALRELRIVALGEDAPPEYVEVATSKYAALYDMLLTEGLVAWASSADIPEYAEQPLTMMLAYLCAGPLGVGPERRAELAQLGGVGLPAPSLAERQLRRQLAKSYVSYPAQSEYF